MNKSFTKSKELILDENYKITPDSDSGVILVFSEMRQREKEIKKVKTGVIEDYLFTENLYYPRIAQALRYYSNKVINASKSLEDCISKTESVYNLISKLDTEFNQF